MKNLKFLVLMLVGLSLTIVSCKKNKDDDDNTTPTPTNQTCYFNRMDFGDYYMIAEYNADKKLIKLTDYDSLGQPDGYYTQLNYNSNGLAAMLSYDGTTIDSKIEFIYLSGTTPDSAVMYSDNNGTLERTGAYSLTYTNGKLTKAEMNYEIMGFPIVISKTEYMYSGNNVTKASYYEFNMTSLSLELTQTEEYEYDAKKSPFYHLGISPMMMFDAMFGAENNAVKITYKDGSGVISQEDSENITYEYNSNNYPTKAVSTSFDNSYTETEIYSYNCY